MTATINRDDWLRALAEAEGPTDQDAITVAEFAALAGLPDRTARTRLDAMLKSGVAVRSSKSVQTAVGHRRIVSAYKLVKAPPKKGR